MGKPCTKQPFALEPAWPQSTALAGADWQSNPHPHPTSTHGNAQLPHLAKGEAPLELVVPFKGKGKLPGTWGRGKEDTGREERYKGEPQQARPCFQNLAEEAAAHHQGSPVSTRSAPSTLALPAYSPG